MTRAFLVINGGPKGIRTPVTDVRGRFLKPTCFYLNLPDTLIKPSI